MWTPCASSQEGTTMAEATVLVILCLIAYILLGKGGNRPT